MFWVSALKKVKIKIAPIFTVHCRCNTTADSCSYCHAPKYSELYALQGEKNKRSKKVKDSFSGRKEGEYKIEGMVRSEKRITTVRKLYYY